MGISRIDLPVKARLCQGKYRACCHPQGRREGSDWIHLQSLKPGDTRFLLKPTGFSCGYTFVPPSTRSHRIKQSQGDSSLPGYYHLFKVLKFNYLHNQPSLT